MYIGVPNPNILVPLEKMKIEPEGKSSFEVLYNPESYTQGREVKYAQSQGVATNTPVIQYTGGGAEVLQFRLFFDSMCYALRTWGIEPFPIRLHIETDVPLARGLGHFCAPLPNRRKNTRRLVCKV